RRWVSLAMVSRMAISAARGLLCYLIADPVTRQAVVIDPLPSLLPQYEKAFSLKRDQSLGGAFGPLFC
ncbi:MAG: hypothetical protein ACP5T8_09360, partial [Acidithiobacillus sp.]